MQSPHPAMSLEGHASLPLRFSLSTGQDSLALAGTLLPSIPGWGTSIRGPELSTTLKSTTKNDVTFKERTPKSWQKDTERVRDTKRSIETTSVCTIPHRGEKPTSTACPPCASSWGLKSTAMGQAAAATAAWSYTVGTSCLLWSLGKWLV